MKISLILTTLDEQEHIERCLDSLQQQRRQPDEIVLVDGHSKDNTVELAEQHPLNIDTYYDDGDLAAARNLGIEKASGDLIVFTDVDGYFDEYWLEELEAAMEDNPEAVGAMGKSLTTGSDALNDRSEAREVEQDVVFTHGANMAFRKDILDVVDGFDSNDSCGWEDMDLGYRVSQHGRIVYQPSAIQYDEPHQDNWSVCVRNGRYWYRFIKKHRKPQWIVRPYYYVLKFLLHGEIKRALEEGIGMTYGMLKEIVQ